MYASPFRRCKTNSLNQPRASDCERNGFLAQLRHSREFSVATKSTMTSIDGLLVMRPFPAALFGRRFHAARKKLKDEKDPLQDREVVSPRHT
jgi:hypothetical protein